MNDENRPQQVPANADGNLRETHDDESALHSDWGSDESIHESLGDGRPRDAIELRSSDLGSTGGGVVAGGGQTVEQHRALGGRGGRGRERARQHAQHVIGMRA